MMESTKLPDAVPALSISPARIEVIFSEGPKGPLAFVSPPLEDINEMTELERASFSLKDAISNSSLLHDAALQRIEELAGKRERFGESSTFLNRLANLNAVLGDFEAERNASERAFELQQSPFLARKLGETRARLGDSAGATEIFKAFAEIDSYSALRLASFSVMERDFDQAHRWLTEAVSLNPAGYAERLFQGAFHLVRGNPRAAISYFKIALDDRPNSSVAYSNLGLAYLGVHRSDKAFECLKRSVALDPFNRSALIALADVGSLLQHDADVVNCLRYFVEFEQRDASVWGRLARSLLHLGKIDDCIHALKRQGALSPSVAVWNNLGVAYAKQKQTAAGLRAFKHALTLETEDIRQDLLVARNASALISKAGQFDVLLTITGSLVENDTSREIATDSKLSDIYSMHMHGLMKKGRTAEALMLADELLCVEGLSDALTRWIVTTQTATYGLERNADGKLEVLLDDYSSRLGEGAIGDVRLLNNLAFAFAEVGRLKEADACINRVSWAVHKDAYITATLGLIAMRKGNIAKGESLYREAIGMATQVSDKTRIRQKLHVELGKALTPTDRRRSRKMLLKAAEEKRGEAALNRQARSLLNSLTDQGEST